MIAPFETRLDQPEALAATTLLAIRDRVSLQQELNGQQIEFNTAGMVELRNLVANFVRGQA